jgi:hypothetical protein
VGIQVIWVTSIQKERGCFFFHYVIDAQAAQLAISNSRSVLQEQQGSNQSQAVQDFESKVKNSTSTILVLPLT